MASVRPTKAPPIGASLFLATFGLYVFTAAPSVTFWDSGELITAACTLGITHQPGYPLFSLVAKAFSYLPLGNIAFRANLQSCVFASLSVYMLYVVLRLLLSGRGSVPSVKDDIAAATLALLFGVSKTLWTQAVVAEVYGLNALFLTSIVYIHVLNSRGELSSARYVALSGLLLGLGTVNHITAGLLLPGMLVSWYLALRRSGYAFKATVYGAAFFLTGMSVLIYLPIRSLARPYLNIGYPETLGNFLWTVRWGAYAEQALALAGSAGGRLAKAGSDIPGLTVGLAVLAVCMVLVWALIRRDMRTYLPLAVFVAVYVPVTSGVALSSGRDMSFGLHEKFFIPMVAFALIFLGGLLGSVFVGERARYRAGLRYAIFIVCMFAAVYLVRVGLPVTDYHKHFIAYDYAQNSLKSVGERGVLLTWGDNGVFPLWYVQGVERYRDDILLAHTPLMTYDWYLNDINRRAGIKIDYMNPFFLGENAYRIMKADPSRPFSYDYSSAKNLELRGDAFKLRGLVCYEGYVPPGNPWKYYIFRGVDGDGVPIGKMEDNIIDIYWQMARVTDGRKYLPFTR